MRILSALLVSLLVPGCVIDARQRDTPIGPDRQVRLSVPAQARLDIRLPAGALRIQGVSGNELVAEMTVLCPAEDSRCAERLRDLDWISAVEGDHVILRTNRDGSLGYRDAEVRAVVRIPPVRSVNVDITAGELDIEDLRGCLTVDMGAGDIDAGMAAEQVATARIDAGMGDASLAVNGRHISAPRSWLVGAQLTWEEGRGDCHVDVDLQAGDIFLELF